MLNFYCNSESLLYPCWTLAVLMLNPCCTHANPCCTHTKALSLSMLYPYCTHAEPLMYSCWTFIVLMLNLYCTHVEPFLYLYWTLVVPMLCPYCTHAEPLLYSYWTLVVPMLNPCTHAESLLYPCTWIQHTAYIQDNRVKKRKEKNLKKTLKLVRHFFSILFFVSSFYCYLIVSWCIIMEYISWEIIQLLRGNAGRKFREKNR